MQPGRKRRRTRVRRTSFERLEQRSLLAAITTGFEGISTSEFTVGTETDQVVSNDNFAAETLSKLDPVITWTDPADITFGILIGATQLNATADVPGSFVYDPPAGTRLNPGTSQVLSVTFSPDDSDQFNELTETVSLNVLVSPDFRTLDGSFNNLE